MASRRRVDLDPVLDLEPAFPEQIVSRPLRDEVHDLVERFTRAGELVVQDGAVHGRRLLAQMRKAVDDIEGNRLAYPKVTPERLVRVVLDAARDETRSELDLDRHGDRLRAALKRAGILRRVPRPAFRQLQKGVEYVAGGGRDKRMWLQHVANAHGEVQIDTLVRDFNRWVKGGKVAWP